MRDSALGRLVLPICLFLLPAPSPLPAFGVCVWGVPVWRRVGFGVGAEALQRACFNQLCVGEAGGEAGAGSGELGSLALLALGASLES